MFQEMGKRKNMLERELTSIKKYPPVEMVFPGDFFKQGPDYYQINKRFIYLIIRILRYGAKYDFYFSD